MIAINLDGFNLENRSVDFKFRFRLACGGLLKHGSLLGHDLDLALRHSPVAVGAPVAVGVAALGVLVVLGTDPLTDPTGLELGRRPEDLGGEPAARRVQVSAT
jgi:hypothetical protein